MKKTWIIVTALVLALMFMCSSCGKSGTDLPWVTARPGEEADDGMIAADANKRPDPNDRVAYEAWLATLSEEQRYVEVNLVGHKVEDLYEYLGKPKSASYSTSCLVEGGEDGVLFYDGFIVSTTRFPNGTEYIMGTEKMG